MLVAAILLATGCGAGAPTPDPDVLRVAMLGSENETLDYGSAQSYFPWTVIGNSCDSLVVTRDGRVTPSLATEVTPNDDATIWTVRIRDDARFHDGTQVTADDVAGSIRYFAASPGFASAYAAVDLAAMSVVDPTTLTVPLTRPRADFVESVLTVASIVYKGGDGAAERPMCGGPFRVESFDPATGAVLVRNDEHWGTVPSVARLEIQRVPDPQARINALLGGSADYAVDLPQTAQATIGDTSGVRLEAGGAANSNALYFVLNSRVAPFTDPGVRRAVAQAVDRAQLRSVVLGESGEIGNDLFGRGLDGYAEGVEQRDRDLAAARDTLAAAGVDRLTLTVAELTPGLRASADLLTQQLAEVGVTVEVEAADPSSYFTDLDRLSSTQIITMYAQNRSAVSMLGQVFGEDNPYAFSGWNPPEFSGLVERIQSTVDPVERSGLVEQVQRLQWDQAPHLVWGYRPTLSAARSELSGVVLNLGVPLFAEAGWN